MSIMIDQWTFISGEIWRASLQKRLQKCLLRVGDTSHSLKEVEGESYRSRLGVNLLKSSMLIYPEPWQNFIDKNLKFLLMSSWLSQSFLHSEYISSRRKSPL